MWKLKIILFSCIFVYARKVLGDEDDFGDDETRIVGGNIATEVLGYQVSLRNDCMLHFCAGAIIANRWIITAAHCLISGYAKYAAVGTIKMVPDFQLYIVKRYIIHPRYDRTRSLNDIGLIQTAAQMQFNLRVWALILPKRNLIRNVELTVAGWGRTSFPGQMPDTLHVIKVKSLSNEDCEELLNRTIPLTNFCTYEGIGKGFCHGDSGGPLVIGKTLYGIISYGRPCAIGYPDVNTRVFKYLTWINTEIKSYRDP